MRGFKSTSTVGALLAAVLLASCNGFFPASDSIIAITVSPTGAYVKPTGTQQFTATATFGNNTTGDVTSQVSWLSSATNIATIDSGGLATGVALGNTTITAKSNNNNSVMGTATLTVSSKIVTTITVSPSNPTLLLAGGQNQQFTANATFSDGTMGDVTNSCAWTSSNTGVAIINSSGLASPVATGSTTIGASLNGIAGTTTLTIQ